MYVGDYADAPKTEITLTFDEVEPASPPVFEEFDTTGYIHVYVFHGHADGGGTGWTYSVSLHKYGLLNTKDYGANSITYEVFPGDPRIGLCKIKTHVTTPVWVGAVASTATHVYDVHELPPELQNGPNPYIAWTPDYIWPGPSEEEATVVFLDVTNVGEPPE